LHASAALGRDDRYLSGISVPPIWLGHRKKERGGMKHTLSIAMRQGPVWRVTAELDLGDVQPDSVDGRLLGLSKEELLKLKSVEEAIVSVNGRRYKFAELQSDGAFTLRKDWD